MTPAASGCARGRPATAAATTPARMTRATRTTIAAPTPRTGRAASRGSSTTIATVPGRVRGADPGPPARGHDQRHRLEVPALRCVPVVHGSDLSLLAPLRVGGRRLLRDPLRRGVGKLAPGDGFRRSDDDARAGGPRAG